MAKIVLNEIKLCLFGTENQNLILKSLFLLSTLTKRQYVTTIFIFLKILMRKRIADALGDVSKKKPPKE